MLGRPAKKRLRLPACRTQVITFLVIAAVIFFCVVLPVQAALAKYYVHAPPPACMPWQTGLMKTGYVVHPCISSVCLFLPLVGHLPVPVSYIREHFTMHAPHARQVRPQAAPLTAPSALCCRSPQSPRRPAPAARRRSTRRPPAAATAPPPSVPPSLPARSSQSDTADRRTGRQKTSRSKGHQYSGEGMQHYADPGMTALQTLHICPACKRVCG